MQVIFNDCENRAKGKDIYKAMSCYNTGNHAAEGSEMDTLLRYQEI